ncbi:MAG: LytTR family DNA-binding domain-containing protein [Oscillospiraceae bacterium]|jgi:two-component system LytT family response regulator|nr:LytTR family DNA-binding domain-containing protein [Oscillospiraceae bacterium]
MPIPIKIAVCDDDAVFCEQLKQEIAQYFASRQLEVEISVFHSGEELTAQPKSYHLAFLDIEMEKMNGIQAGRWLKKQNPDVLLFFITAYDCYLDDAFDLDAFRYLKKPVDKDRLYHGLDVALQNNHRLSCMIDGKLRIIFVRDIVCVYAEKGKSVLITQDSTFYTAYPLAHWKKQLYEPFFSQPHSSYIINFYYVAKFEKEAVTLQYGKNQMKIYISQRRYYPFRHDFFQWMESGQNT